MRTRSKSSAPAGPTPSFTTVLVYCDCDRFGGRQHGIAPAAREWTGRSSSSPVPSRARW